jgi:hypothetical protein
MIRVCLLLFFPRLVILLIVLYIWHCFSQVLLVYRLYHALYFASSHEFINELYSFSLVCDYFSYSSM